MRIGPLLSLLFCACAAAGAPTVDPPPPPAAAPQERAPEPVLTLAESLVSPTGEVVATLTAPPFYPPGQQRGEVIRAAHLWSLRTGEPLRRIGGREYPVSGMSFSPDGRLLATGSFGQGAALWEVRSGRLIRALSGDTLAAWVRFGPRGEQVLLESGAVRIVDPATGEVLRQLELRSFQPVFSPDGRLLAGPHRGRAGIWHIAGDSLLRVIGPEIAPGRLHGPSTRQVEFSPDGRRLLLTGYGVGPSEWNVETGAEAAAWYHLPRSTWDDIVGEHGRYSPTGDYLLVRIEGGTDAWLWEAGRAEPTALDEAPRRMFASDAVMIHTAFSPDERYLITTHEDASTRLWCVATGQELFRRFLLGDGGWLVLAPDGIYDGDAASVARIGEVAELVGATPTRHAAGLVERRRCDER